VACTGACNEGFHCQGGVCVLNGGGGPVQVTLRWDQPEDLDLHVVEPLPAGGSCEIWYGDSKQPCRHHQLRRKGSLDLDSNAGLQHRQRGHRERHLPARRRAARDLHGEGGLLRQCGATARVPYEVTVRANGATQSFCGSFLPNAADNGAAGSGVLITTFVVP